MYCACKRTACPTCWLLAFAANSFAAHANLLITRCIIYYVFVLLLRNAHKHSASESLQHATACTVQCCKSTGFANAIRGNRSAFAACSKCVLTSDLLNVRALSSRTALHSSVHIQSIRRYIYYSRTVHFSICPLFRLFRLFHFCVHYTCTCFSNCQLSLTHLRVVHSRSALSYLSLLPSWTISLKFFRLFSFSLSSYSTLF